MEYLLFKKDLEKYSKQDLNKLAKYLNTESDIWSISIAIANKYYSSNLDSSICSNKMDIFSLDEWNDSDNPELGFDIYRDSKLLFTTCYKQRDFIKMLEDNQFFVWKARPGKIFEDTGHGGEPDYTRKYFKMNTDKFTIYIKDSDIVKKLLNGTFGRYRLDYLGKERIGSPDPTATLQISVLHGQAPGEDTYELKEIEVLEHLLPEFEEEIPQIVAEFPEFYNIAKRGYFDIEREYDENDNVIDYLTGEKYFVSTKPNEFLIIERKNNINHGKYMKLKKINDNWIKIVQGQFNNGEKNGEARTFDEITGNLLLINNYKNGKKHGKMLEFNNGKLTNEEYYENDIKLSEKIYHDNGLLHSEITYNNQGKQHGIEKLYYDDGNIEIMSYWENGTKKWQKEYYLTGELMQEITFDSFGDIKTKKNYDITGTLIKPVPKKLVFE